MRTLAFKLVHANPDVHDRRGDGDGEGGGKEAGEAEEETKKTLGELGMAASGPAGPPPLRATPARAPRRRRWSDRSSGSWGLGEGGAAERVERGGGHGRLEAQLVEPSRAVGPRLVRRLVFLLRPGQRGPWPMCQIV